MGAGSSVITNNIKDSGRIFKTLNCQCICSLIYSNYCVQDIELLVPCWDCLESLKNKEYDSKQISKLFRNLLNTNINDLIDPNNQNRWLTESEGIEYARKRKIPYEEFVPNDEFEKFNPNVSPRDLLKRFCVSL